MPIGCRPAPPSWPQAPDRFADEEEATRVWKEVVACIELEVLGLHDLQGKEAEKFKRKGKGPNVARPTLQSTV